MIHPSRRIQNAVKEYIDNTGFSNLEYEDRDHSELGIHLWSLTFGLSPEEANDSEEWSTYFSYIEDLDSNIHAVIKGATTIGMTPILILYNDLEDDEVPDQGLYKYDGFSIIITSAVTSWNITIVSYTNH